MWLHSIKSRRVRVLSSMRVAAMVALFIPGAAMAQDAPETETAENGTEEDLSDPIYTMPAPVGARTVDPFVITGYIDVGFVKAQGDGTSFSPNDRRVPLDYGNDPFATAVNSRGDVASWNPGPGDRVINGFVPHSTGVGGKPSFLLNTASVDLRYIPASIPLLMFTRLQFMPRFLAEGDASRVLLQQAFGRLTPFENLELALSVGKFDSVFGIEYLQNESNLRTGVTPSLIARYTTGRMLGAKVFFRQQIAPLWSAVSLNVAVTNGGPEAEPLQTQSRSLTGSPVVTGRLGIEVNVPFMEIKAGASGMYGARNDQVDPGIPQRALGFDLRIIVEGLTVNAEWLHFEQDEATSGIKLTELGPWEFASGFAVEGFYVTAEYRFGIGDAFRAVTPYLRYGHREATFLGFQEVIVDRFTPGLRVDFWDNLALKAEYLINREIDGAPNVDNNVFTSSLVFTW